MPEYSEKQVGIIGQYEPELCAVSGRPIRGKHAVTHYKGDGVHYVRVLNQFDDKWPEAAPIYGFPVHEENSAQDENVFVLDESLNTPINVYGGGSDQPIASSLPNSDNPPFPPNAGKIRSAKIIAPTESPKESD